MRGTDADAGQDDVAELLEVDHEVVLGADVSGVNAFGSLRKCRRHRLGRSS